jgi:hypothetical protein
LRTGQPGDVLVEFTGAGLAPVVPLDVSGTITIPGRRELRRIREQALQQGAEVLLTTEKDMMNLPPDLGEILALVQVLWLRIGVAIEQEEDLVRRIRAIIR